MLSYAYFIDSELYKICIVSMEIANQQHNCVGIINKHW